MLKRGTIVMTCMLCVGLMGWWYGWLDWWENDIDLMVFGIEG